MTSQRLIGMKVKITVSDPWEFVTENGSGPFTAVVDHAQGDSLLIHFESLVMSCGHAYKYFVVSPRSASDDLEDLDRAGRIVRIVNCNLSAISDEAARSARPCDVRSWRGGLGLLGSIEPSGADKKQDKP